MKKVLFAAVLAACAAAPVLAADAPAAAPAKPLTAQQQKMKDCNADAKTKALKGADRKAFMKTCLSKDGAPAAAAAAPAAPASPQAAQQQKMKDCNADAKTKALKGADRKAYMKTCLSGSTSTAAPAAAPAK
ncbi:MAG: PsiF family protein [Nevskia sp.]|nr:PsiF family protein [Nevskia sp.]